MAAASPPSSTFIFEVLRRAIGSTGGSQIATPAIHALLLTSGLLASDLLLTHSLISTYSRFNRLSNTQLVFPSTPHPNISYWNSLLSGSSDSSLSPLLHRLGVTFNDVTFISALASASHARNGLPLVLQLHSHLFKSGFHSHTTVGNSLLMAYARCRSQLDDAHKLFDEMPDKDMCEDALVAFSSLLLQHAWREMKPNQYPFGSLVSAISRAESVPLAYGLRCHCRALKLGLDSDGHVSSALIDMYAKRGEIEEAEMFIQKMAPVEPDISSLQALLGACRIRGDVMMARRIVDKLLCKLGYV